jgi:hypothetical protein
LSVLVVLVIIRDQLSAGLNDILFPILIQITSQLHQSFNSLRTKRFAEVNSEIFARLKHVQSLALVELCEILEWLKALIQNVFENYAIELRSKYFPIVLQFFEEFVELFQLKINIKHRLFWPCYTRR